MLKLLVSDLDGTLLRDDKQLPPDFWEVESQLVNSGILF